METSNTALPVVGISEILSYISSKRSLVFFVLILTIEFILFTLTFLASVSFLAEGEVEDELELIISLFHIK